MSLKRNALWNLAGTAIPMVAGLALIPFTLNRLGSEAFGVLTLVWGLIGYFSVFDLGVGRALTVQLSQLGANGRTADAGPLLRSGMLLTLGAGVLGMALQLHGHLFARGAGFAKRHFQALTTEPADVQAAKAALRTMAPATLVEQDVVQLVCQRAKPG